ncbi:hypothetical protein T05_15311 [Trichinella murrelli]|uniref:Uncharacterized protein n=1 Tax=Trichinella murrelli TaxID=144512 RepID=A0A0V0UCL4_9BILA|nr:hypothetical protein T05_15311 [Trichinella murrelli]
MNHRCSILSNSCASHSQLDSPNLPFFNNLRRQSRCDVTMEMCHVNMVDQFEYHCHWENVKKFNNLIVRDKNAVWNYSCCQMAAVLMAV